VSTLPRPSRPSSKRYPTTRTIDCLFPLRTSHFAPSPLPLVPSTGFRFSGPPWIWAPGPLAPSARFDDPAAYRSPARALRPRNGRASESPGRGQTPIAWGQAAGATPGREPNDERGRPGQGRDSDSPGSSEAGGGSATPGSGPTKRKPEPRAGARSRAVNPHHVVHSRSRARRAAVRSRSRRMPRSGRKCQTHTKTLY
jgi:hypothetical protein